MLISIIIPVYNASHYLNDLIKSIRNQTYKQYEIIFINDCSIDNSLELIENFSHHTSIKVSIINNEYNQGAALSRNKGINRAIGKYIYFMDADDTITPDCLELLAQKAKLYNYPEILCANIDTEILNLKTIPEIYYSNNKNIRNSYFSHEWHECPVNKLISREFIIDNNIYFPNIYQEDTPWSFKTSLLAKSLVILPNKTYIYRQVNSSKMNSRKDINKIINDQFTCFSLMYTYGRQSTNNIKPLLFLTYICTSHLFAILRNNSIPLNNKKQAYVLQRKNSTIKDIIYGFISSYISLGIKILLIYRFLPSTLGMKYLLYLSKYFKQ